MREPKVESKLKALGYEFRYVASVPFAEIDINGAAANPARYGKRLDAERVESMTVAVRNGTEFAAVVVCRLDVPSLYRYSLGEGSGLHRVMAYKKAGLDTCDAYVVNEPDAERRRMLPTLLNSIEGMTNAVGDRYRAIFDLVARRVGDVTALCIAYSVRKDGYLAFERLEKTKARIVRLGWNVERFNNDQIREFGKIHSDKILTAAVGFSINLKASAAALHELVLAINGSTVKTEEAWLAIVNEHIAKLPKPPQPGDPKGRMKPASEKWCDHIHAALNLHLREKYSVLDGDLARIRTCIDDGLNMLKTLKGELVRRGNFRRSA